MNACMTMGLLLIAVSSYSAGHLTPWYSCLVSVHIYVLHSLQYTATCSTYSIFKNSTSYSIRCLSHHRVS